MCQSLSCVLDMGHWVPKIGFWGKLSQTVFVVLPAVEIFNPCKSTYKWNTTLIHLHIIEGQTTDNIEWFFSRVNKGGVLLRISFMLTFFFFLIQTDNRLIFFFFLMDFCPKSEENKNDHMVTMLILHWVWIQLMWKVWFPSWNLTHMEMLHYHFHLVFPITFSNHLEMT